MEDTGSSPSNRLMTLKKLDDPKSKDFWDFVERSKQEWSEQQPTWSRDLEQRTTSSQQPSEEAQPVVEKIICD